MSLPEVGLERTVPVIERVRTCHTVDFWEIYDRRQAGNCVKPLVQLGVRESYCIQTKMALGCRVLSAPDEGKLAWKNTH
jgi:hypothetical protein